MSQKSDDLVRDSAARQRALCGGVSSFYGTTLGLRLLLTVVVIFMIITTTSGYCTTTSLRLLFFGPFILLFEIIYGRMALSVSLQCGFPVIAPRVCPTSDYFGLTFLFHFFRSVFTWNSSSLC